MKKRIGIWIRVSTDEQAKGESPEHHRERAMLYAKLQDWTVVEVYNLEAVSGKSVMHHSEAQRMLSDVKKGHIEGLIFSKLARLARNTRELLDFSDIFRQYNADLISLEEKIDTSSPAGRFFYTLISAMSQWEREEISSRVAASVPIRAKMGKPLGGDVPYGYKREGKELVLDPIEAPIRKLIHELFAQHKRKKKVAKLINDKGYRTRKGDLFSGTTIDRFLRDPIAKGMRRVNYTRSLGENKKWEIKPKEEWVFIPAPRIISDELWQQCNDILDNMARKPNQVRSAGVYLFSGVVTCECGDKMYMRKLSPKYICKQCKNKIEPDILEEVFQEQLKNFLFSDVEIQKKINADKQSIEDKKLLLMALHSESQKLKEKIDKLFDLYYENKLTKEEFQAQHAPLSFQHSQKLAEITQLESTIDALSINTLSSDQVLYDARNLHKQWVHFSQEEKKNIIGTVIKNITVGKDDIEIELAYLPILVPQTAQDRGGKSVVNDGVNQNRHDFDQRNPDSFVIGKIKERNYRDSWRRPA